MKNNQTFKSDISGISFPENEKIYGRAIHDPILGLIKKEYPDFSTEDCISINELNVYRQKYISNYLSSEIGALSAM